MQLWVRSRVVSQSMINRLSYVAKSRQIMRQSAVQFCCDRANASQVFRQKGSSLFCPTIVLLQKGHKVATRGYDLAWRGASFRPTCVLLLLEDIKCPRWGYDLAWRAARCHKVPARGYDLAWYGASFLSHMCPRCCWRS